MISKVKERAELQGIVERLRTEGKRIVFTNGCFDLLHVGHVRLLWEAKSHGDVLIVGLNSDSSTRKIKGEGRPIVPEAERAEVLSALEMVDYITVFDEPDPYPLITLLSPHVLIKGADWPMDAIVGRDWVESHGGQVVQVALVEGRSTSSLIETILKRGEACPPSPPREAPWGGER